jgi:hypothetical protein
LATDRRSASRKVFAKPWSENFNGDGMGAAVNKFLQRIIHKAMPLNP